MKDVQYRVAGVLPSTKALQAVIDSLEVRGFDRAQFGVLATKSALSGRSGYESADEIAEDRQATTEAEQEPESEGALTGALVGGLIYLGSAAAAGVVVLTGGGLGLALAAIVAAGGTGGLVGALVAHGFHEHHANMINDELANGGLVLWIRPRDDHQEHAAIAELEALGAKKVVVQGSG